MKFLFRILLAIKPGSGADPWVLQHGDSYYLLYTTGGDVQVTRSSNLAQWANKTSTVVYKPPSPFSDVWAPELHLINGQFYIYVAMAKSGDNSQHHMYVLKGTSTTDPTQPFEVSNRPAFVHRGIEQIHLRWLGKLPPRTTTGLLTELS